LNQDIKLGKTCSSRERREHTRLRESRKKAHKVKLYLPGRCSEGNCHNQSPIPTENEGALKLDKHGLESWLCHY